MATTDIVNRFPNDILGEILCQLPSEELRRVCLVLIRCSRLHPVLDTVAALSPQHYLYLNVDVLQRQEPAHWWSRWLLGGQKALNISPDCNLFARFRRVLLTGNNHDYPDIDLADFAGKTFNLLLRLEYVTMLNPRLQLDLLELIQCRGDPSRLRLHQGYQAPSHVGGVEFSGRYFHFEGDLFYYGSVEADVVEIYASDVQHTIISKCNDLILRCYVVGSDFFEVVVPPGLLPQLLTTLELAIPDFRFLDEPPDHVQSLTIVGETWGEGMPWPKNLHRLRLVGIQFDRHFALFNPLFPPHVAVIEMVDCVVRQCQVPAPALKTLTVRNCDLCESFAASSAHVDVEYLD